jgi:hypothetical protein
MNELVFIGQGIEKEQMITDLNACLLQDNEKHLVENKIMFSDPFPKEFKTK